MREAACTGEKTLDSFKSEQNKSVSCVNEDEPSSRKHKPNREECVKNLIAKGPEMAEDWRLCRNSVQSTFWSSGCLVTSVTGKDRSLPCTTLLS